jgi:pyruvate/2-oxoglutarate dehydrogenase complex dihydrolipoamide acyltransferase (E2) component
MPLLGLAEFEAAIARVSADADAASKAAVSKAAAQVEADAKKSFQGAHKKGEPHVGGNQPNVVTGMLRRSIQTDPITRFGLSDYGTAIAPRAIYARSVEYGHDASSHGYPFFMPAAEKTGREFPSIAAEQWARFMH